MGGCPYGAEDDIEDVAVNFTYNINCVGWRGEAYGAGYLLNCPFRVGAPKKRSNYYRICEFRCGDRVDPRNRRMRRQARGSLNLVALRALSYRRCLGF